MSFGLRFAYGGFFLGVVFLLATFFLGLVWPGVMPYTFALFVVCYVVAPMAGVAWDMESES